MILVRVPIRTISCANVREGWVAKHRRVANERRVTSLVLSPVYAGNRIAPPFDVRLCRVAPRALDGDNLAACLKAVRDAVADVLGLASDREGDLVSWEYQQRREGAGDWAVEIEVRPRGTREARKEAVMPKAKPSTREIDDAVETVKKHHGDDAVESGRRRIAPDEDEGVGPDKMFRNLPVKLTEEERATKGRELAKATKQITTLEAEKKNAADDYKGRIALAQGTAARLAETCDSGIEFREVEVIEQRDHRRFEMQLIRIDTKEVVSVRPMTTEERQESLPFEGAKAKGAPKRSRKAAAEAGAPAE